MRAVPELLSQDRRGIFTNEDVEVHQHGNHILASTGVSLVTRRQNLFSSG